MLQMALAMWRMAEKYLMMMKLKIPMLRSIAKSLEEARKERLGFQPSLALKEISETS